MDGAGGGEGEGEGAEEHIYLGIKSRSYLSEKPHGAGTRISTDSTDAHGFYYFRSVYIRATRVICVLYRLLNSPEALIHFTSSRFYFNIFIINHLYKPGADRNPMQDMRIEITNRR